MLPSTTDNATTCGSTFTESDSNFQPANIPCRPLFNAAPLIVCDGPTGAVAALLLKSHGAPVRLIDRRSREDLLSISPSHIYTLRLCVRVLRVLCSLPDVYAKLHPDMASTPDLRALVLPAKGGRASPVDVPSMMGQVKFIFRHRFMRVVHDYLHDIGVDVRYCTNVTAIRSFSKDTVTTCSSASRGGM